MQIKANSLLYAVYVCLIVAIICSGLLYFSGLYRILNLYYNTREALYIQNDSALQYFLSKESSSAEDLITEDGIVSKVQFKNYGLLKVAIVQSIYHNDTLNSSHFVGSYTINSTALHLAQFSPQISYSGLVTLIGDKVLPYANINERYIGSNPNVLISKGKISSSSGLLPSIRSDLKNGLIDMSSSLANAEDIGSNPRGAYFNSFENPTIKIISDYTIGLKRVKGNFIITSNDSLELDKTLSLEDVIISAPVVKIRRGFSGSVQIFATQKVVVEEDVVLQYPSSVVLYNDSEENGEIIIGKNSTVKGAVVLYGNPIESINQNNIRLLENSLIVGDVYASGKIIMVGKVYGTVYAYRLCGQNSQSIYENCLIDTTIDVSLRPDYFVSIPLFNEKKVSFEPIKKVF